MKAQVLNDYGDADQFQLTNVPTPDAAPGQVRIRVQAIGLNPMDLKIRSGSLRDEIPTPFPAILGSDVAGAVDQTGEGVGLAVGLRVAGLAQHGAYAEYAVTSQDLVSPIPDTLDIEHAATIPTAAEASRRVIRLLNLKQDRPSWSTALPDRSEAPPCSSSCAPA